jgi:hypothetical protein
MLVLETAKSYWPPTIVGSSSDLSRHAIEQDLVNVGELDALVTTMTIRVTLATPPAAVCPSPVKPRRIGRSMIYPGWHAWPNTGTINRSRFSLPAHRHPVILDVELLEVVPLMKQ